MNFTREDIDRIAATMVAEHRYDEDMICLEPTTPVQNFVVWSRERCSEEEFQQTKKNFTRVLADAISKSLKMLKPEINISSGPMHKKLDRKW